ncbi:hypothetical protein INR49_013286 [Caranx melampygus]|nr:hypothetical protein INR49_013286 [Caranx melampygus]
MLRAESSSELSAARSPAESCAGHAELTPSYLHHHHLQHLRAALQMGGHKPVACFAQMHYLPSTLI